MDWKRKYTSRNFQVIDFKDERGKECSLQQSSAILDFEDSMECPGSSAVWLGIDKGNQRIHLDRDQVSTLRGYLGHWLEYGKFFFGEDD